MDCPGCGRTTRADARFCKFCGASLRTQCSSCGAGLDPESRFCESCGTAVGAGPGDTPAIVPAARKVVTVVFADLTGSTALEERMDIESVRSMVARFYASMVAEVERHAGRVVKFAGDGVMAAFGVPDIAEDDAARAIDCAVAMRSVCEQLAEELELPLALKIGINTGEVVVGGADDFVVGDSVNVAARLESAAASGEILVGEETFRVTRGRTRYEAIPPLDLKGKSEPVPAYRLLSVDDSLVESQPAPFVGRDDELGSLLVAFDDAVAANAARLVTIIGSPGLGKTRLAQELMSQLADRARVRETRCDATSATLAPIADALRAAAAIPDAADEATIVALLAERIPPDDPDRDRIATLTAAVLGAGRPGSTQETFWALRRMVEVAASDRPVVLVLDDLHWAEPVLLDLVEHLAEWIRAAPVLLVGTGRPELRELRPSLVEGGRTSSVIALEGLDESATTRLALGLLGADELPRELLAKIPASTQGNPLFVRELIRMLVDDEVLVPGADGWTVTVEVEGIDVPPTIQSLLAARVDRLGDEERSVLELASVVGHEFYRGVLRELTTVDVDARLESLRRKELIEPVGTYWIDEPVYRFHHVLIRDAAYRRVLKETRADVHQRVAAWLERKTSDVVGEHEEVIGYHLEQAHGYLRELGRPDDDLGCRASALLGQATRRALDRDDMPAAAALSARALDAFPTGNGSRAELLLIRCEALLSMGDVGLARAAVDELASVASSPRLSHWSTCFAAQLAMDAEPERLLEVSKSVAAAAVELEALDDFAGAAKAHTVHAASLGRLGRVAECELAYDNALTAARKAGDRSRITAVLGGAPLAHLYGPNPVSRAGGRCLDLVRLSRITTGSRAVEVTSVRCQAVLEAFRGRFDAARRMLEETRETLQDLGLRYGLLETDLFAGIVELTAREWTSAIEPLRRALDGFLARGVDAAAAQAAAFLARAHLELGEEDAADQLARRSEELAGQDLQAAIAWRCVRAELLARRGAYEDARAVADAAVEIASATDALVYHGHACRASAAVYRAAGDLDGAKGAEEQARALYERKGATAFIDERAVVVGSRPVAQPSRRLENACTRVEDAHLSAVMQDEDTSSFFSAEFVGEDRRRGLRHEFHGQPDWENVRNVGVRRVTGTPIAIRGERLALYSVVLSGRRQDPTAFYTRNLVLSQLDDDGMLCRRVVFDDPDDIDAAMSELDERFIAGEGAEHADVVRLVAESIAAINDGNWELYRANASPDFVLVDHRATSLGEVHDVGALIEAHRSLLALLTEPRVDVVAYHALSVDRGLCEFVTRGSTADGAPLELPFLSVFAIRDGAIARAEFFAVDDIEAARARFDELDTSRDTKWALTNKAADLGRRLAAALEASDWRAYADALSENAAVEDRRTPLVIRESVSGREALVAQAQSIVRSGIVGAPVTTIAIRGERLALDRLVLRGKDVGSAPFETELLQLFECDEDDRLGRIVLFDADDMEAAFAELDERYVAGEGAEHADIVRLGAEAVAAINRRDWDTHRRAMADDFRCMDHRAVSLGEVTTDELIRSMQTLVELAPDVRIYVTAVHGLSPRGDFLQELVTGHTADGGVVEFTFLSTSERRNGRAIRSDLYSLDQFDLAATRFDEIGRTTEVAKVRNRATAALTRFYADWSDEKWEAIEKFFTAGSRWVDRRVGIQTEYVGREALMEFVQSVDELTSGIRFGELDFIAVRGERLALGRVLARSTDDLFETEAIVVWDVDDDGHLIRQISFDVDGLDEAFGELDELFAAGEGADCSDFIRLGSRGIAAFNRRDWDAWRNVMADDFVCVDHRTISLGELDASGMIEAQKRLVELLPDLHIFTSRPIEMRPEIDLSEQVTLGRTTDGEPWELTFLSLSQIRDGLLARSEIFSPDQIDVALARLVQLGRMTRMVENRCSREMRKVMAAAFPEAISSAMQETGSAARLLIDLFSRDIVAIDARAGLRNEVVGLDAFLTNFETMVDIGFAGISASTLAVRGERLALLRARFEYGDQPSHAYNVELLLTVAIGTDDKITRLFAADEYDLDAALAELEAWYAAGDGQPYGELLRAGSELLRAHNQGDWDAYGAVLTDDVVIVDHRPVSLGELHGREAEVNVVRQLRELIPDLRYHVAAHHAIAATRALAEVFCTGTTSEGADVDLRYLGIYELDGARIRRFELFSIDQFEEALARFDELESVRSPRDNLAARILVEATEATFRGDLERVRALQRPDVRSEDRRQGLQFEHVGIDEVIEGARVAGAIGVTAVRHTVLGLRADRYALVRFEFEGIGGSFAGAVLTLGEVDEQGRCIRSAIFDPDDLYTAFAELDEWYIAGEGRGYAEVVRTGMRWLRAQNDGDWEALWRLVAEDIVLVDRHLVSPGELRGRDAAFEWVRGLRELIPNVRFHVAALHAVDGQHALCETVGTGATADGATIEYPQLGLAVFRDGQFVRLENFPIEKLDAARERFDELTVAATTIVPANDACRSVQRFHAAFAQRDWAGMSELFIPDAVATDRRFGIGNTYAGSAAIIAAFRGIAEIDVLRYDYTLLATRGPSLALGRFDAIFSEAESFELDFLAVDEIDEDGRFTSIEVFDCADLEAAYEALDARYFANDPSDESYALTRALHRAYNGHDLELFGTMLADDVVYEDHRPVSMGRRDRDGMMRATRAMWDVADVQLTTRAVHRRSETASLIRIELTGLTPDSGEVEFVSDVISVRRGSQIVRIEVFPIDRLDDAVQRFDELTRQEASPSLDNECIRVHRRFAAAVVRRDWDEAAECVSDEFVLADHRIGIANVEDKEGLFAGWKHLVDLGLGVTIDIEPIATRGQRLLLAKGRNSDESGLVIDVLGVVEIDELGKLVRFGIFDPDDLEAAYADLERRYRASGSSDVHELVRPAGLPSLENECVRLHASFRAAFERRDWDELAAAYADEFVGRDHRRGIANVLMRVDELAGWKQLAELGFRRSDLRPIATRGERLVLARGIVVNDDGFEIVGLVLLETDERGKLVGAEYFDSEDLDAAYDDLDRRYMAGEGAYALSQMLVECVKAHDARDWDRGRSFFADDLVYVDHRPASLGRMSRDELMQATIGLVDVIPDVRMRCVAVHRIDVDRAVTRMVGEGTDAQGGRVEVPYLNVLRARGRVITDMEFFPIEALDDAVARYDELGWKDPVTRIENDASRLFVQTGEYEPDLEILAALLADDPILEDRRPIFRMEARGRGEVIDLLRVAIDVGASVMRAQATAIRGRRLALVDLTVSGTVRYFEAAILVLVEVDVQGKTKRMIVFDPDALDAAYDELDRLWLESGETTELDRVMVSSVRGYNTRDWDGLRSLFADRAVNIDHRPVGHAESESHDYIENGRVSVELVPDRCVRNTHVIRSPGGGAVYVCSWTGTTRDGAPLEWQDLRVAQVRNGLIVRNEEFASEQLDAALARADELASASAGWALRNHATQVTERLFACVSAGDLDSWAAALSPDIYAVDHRPGLQWEAGYTGTVDSARVIAGRVEITPQPLAIRGDRLCLSLVTFATPNTDFDVNILQLFELDENGLVTAILNYEPEDLDAPYEELDRRWLESSDATELDRAIIACIKTYNERDFEGHRNLFSDDVFLSDSRLVGFGKITIDDHIKGMASQVGRARIDAIIRSPNGAGSVHRVTTAWTTRDGAPVEWQDLRVCAVRDGKIVHLERLAADDLDAAFARADEVARASDPVRRLSNECVRRVEHALARALSGDLDEDLVAEDVLFDDRRPLAQSSTFGREDFLENARAVFDVGFDSIETRCVALRGDRLALIRMLFRAGSDFDVDVLNLCETDEAGRICAWIGFAADDLDAAFEELAERYIAGEGAPYAALFRNPFGEAFARRDWAEASWSVTDDFHVVDHRPVSFGSREGIDALIIDPDLADQGPLRCTEIVAIDHAIALGAFSLSAKAPTGADLEWEMYGLVSYRGELCSSIEIFPIEQRSEAKARFDELAQSSATTAEADRS